jgi:hypothetical protein
VPYNDDAIWVNMEIGKAMQRSYDDISSFSISYQLKFQKYHHNSRNFFIVTSQNQGVGNLKFYMTLHSENKQTIRNSKFKRTNSNISNPSLISLESTQAAASGFLHH